MNCNLKGQITETIVLLEALKRDVTVSIPYGDKSRYDALFDVNGSIYRIQIKTSRNAKKSLDCFTFNCYSTVNGKRRRYSSKEIDYFATVWDNDVYLIPVSECSGEKTLWLRNPLNKNCCMAKKYLFEEVLKTIKH